MRIYFLETLYFIKYKFTKLIPQRYFCSAPGWMSLGLFSIAHALVFHSPDGNESSPKG